MAARIPAKAYLGFFQAPQQQVGDEDEGLLGGGQPGGDEGANPDTSFFGQSEGAPPPGTPTGTPAQAGGVQPYSPEWFMLVYGLTAEQAQIAANHWAVVESKRTSQQRDPQTFEWVTAPSGDPTNSAKVGQGVKPAGQTFNQPDPNFDVGFNLTPAQAQIAKAAWAETKAANPPGTVLNPFDITNWAAKQTGAPRTPKTQWLQSGDDWVLVDDTGQEVNRLPGKAGSPKPRNTQLVQSGEEWVLIDQETGEEIKRYANPPAAKGRDTQALQVGNDWQIVDLTTGEIISTIKGPDTAGAAEIKRKADVEAAQRAAEDEARRSGLAAAIERGMFGYTTDERGQGAFGYRQPDYSGFGGMPPPISFADAAKAYRAGTAPYYLDVPEQTFFGAPASAGQMSGRFGTEGIPAGSVRVQQGTPGYTFFSGQGLKPQQSQPTFGNIPEEPTGADWAAMSPASQAAWMTVAGQYGVTTDPASRANYSRSFWQRNMPVRPSPGYTAAVPQGQPLRQEVVPGMLRPQSFWRR